MHLVRAALLVAVSGSPALAQREPVFVVPGKPGVPVIINGRDASWAVVEGEFGLDRPGHVTPSVSYSPFAGQIPYEIPGFYPRTGRPPGYGRHEIVPPSNRPLPPAAPTYYRNWSSQSEPGPVTDHPAYPSPPVVVAPRFGRRGAPKGQDHSRL